MLPDTWPFYKSYGTVHSLKGHSFYGNISLSGIAPKNKHADSASAPKLWLMIGQYLITLIQHVLLWVTSSQHFPILVWNRDKIWNIQHFLEWRLYILRSWTFKSFFYVRTENFSKCLLRTMWVTEVIFCDDIIFQYVFLSFKGVPYHFNQQLFFWKNVSKWMNYISKKLH